MDTIEIPVTYKNKELCFQAQVVRFGYVNHIVVDINGTEVTIERDEEGNFRALSDPGTMEQSKVDVGLVREIIGVLQSL